MTKTNDMMNELGGRVRRLRRSRDDRMLGGVCGGVAELVGVDPALVRVAMVLLTVFSLGSGVVLYGACWVVVPEADRP
ncbi:MAG: PspC domain-containing protein [Kutzneria sp.]|nr:PspC domain-containing protein [Kutzneria sp.]